MYASPIPLPPKAGSAREGFPGSCSEYFRFWIFPGMEPLQPLWTTCFRVWIPSQCNWSYIHKHLADEEFKTTQYLISLLRNDLPGLKKSSISPCKGIRDYSAMINIFSSEFLTPKWCFKSFKLQAGLWRKRGCLLPKYGIFHPTTSSTCFVYPAAQFT